MNDLEQLQRILNTLYTVKTCGEDTLSMAVCLQALSEYIKKVGSQPTTVQED